LLKLLLSRPKRRNFPKRIRHAPYPRAQSRQLHNLRVIDEEVDIEAKFADIPKSILLSAPTIKPKPHKNLPIKHPRLRLFKDNLFHRQLPQNGLYNIRALTLYILGDALALNHHSLDPRIYKLFRKVFNARGVGRADGFSVTGGGVAAGAELDAEFGFGF